MQHVPDLTHVPRVKTAWATYGPMANNTDTISNLKLQQVQLVIWDV